MGSLMSVGQGKIYFENLKVQGLEFEEILAKCKDYAIRRRLDHAHKKHPDDMDIGAVQTRAETYQDWSQAVDMGGDYLSLENHWFDMDVDTMGKGGKKGGKGYEGKGKGDWFKGKGKGDWNIVVYIRKRLYIETKVNIESE